jgi:hypothetical protein
VQPAAPVQVGCPTGQDPAGFLVGALEAGTVGALVGALVAGTVGALVGALVAFPLNL